MEFKGSRTAANLMKAFAGECQARTRYAFAASVARKEGFQHIAAIFEETAENEKEHAKVFFKHLAPLAGLAVGIEATYPVVAGDTAAQLRAAFEGEEEEHSVLYPEFARIAREEGFEQVAQAFERVARVEQHHERRFRRLYEHVLAETVFARDEAIEWRCRNCGHVHTGPKAPGQCPVCAHERAWFEPVGENF